MHNGKNLYETHANGDTCFSADSANKRPIPGSNFFGKTPLFFRYSGVNATNAVNLLAKDSIIVL